MCGRYAASRSTAELVEELEVQADRTDEPVRSVLVSEQQPPAGEPDWNVAPSKAARVVLTRAPRPAPGEDAVEDADPVRQLRLLTWGLVPSWAKDPKVGVRMTNARAETVFTKPAFRSAVRSRRCLVPADGWYEWQPSPVATDAKGRPRKQPFFMRRADGGSCAVGGLYEFWRDPAAEPGDPLGWLTTFTIVTTAAEPGLDRIHDRQPLVLDREEWAAWLDPACDDPDRVGDLLRVREPGRFDAHPVGRAVGNPRTNGPHLLDPVDPAELVGVVDPVTGEVVGGA